MRKTTAAMLTLAIAGFWHFPAFGGDRVDVCHNSRTLSVSVHALEAHIAHGDSPGACVACVSPPPNMLGWWPGDDDGRDIMGAYDGMMFGGVAIGAGKVLSAFSLDGLDDYVEVGHDPFLVPVYELSLDAWIRTAVTGTSILYKHGAPGDRSYGLQIVSDRADFFIVSGGVTRNHYGTSIVTDGDWHHIAGVFDGAAGRHELYVDGVIENGNVPSYASIDFSSVPIWIGAGAGTTSSAPNAAFFAGEIDEVEIFDRALSPAEVEGIYQAGDKGKCKN